MGLTGIVAEVQSEGGKALVGEKWLRQVDPLVPYTSAEFKCRAGQKKKKSCGAGYTLSRLWL